jgi:hypothetical protein
LGRFLPAVLVVALLCGSAAAFAVTERLKLVRSPIWRTQVSKVVSPRTGRRAKIRFRLRSADSLSLAIVDSRGRVVRALIDSRHVRPGPKTFYWRGTRADGTAVPDGVYKPRVHLSGSHRTIVLPNPILVDTKLPRISLVRRNLTVVSPDGDARHDYLKVFFRTSEPARAVLIARLRQVVKLKSFSAHSLQWGQRNGMPSRPGLYHLSLQAIDRAGNAGPPSAEFTLRVRYIDLAPKLIRVRAGGRIRAHVSTDAHAYLWRIGPRRGQLRTHRLSLAAGAPGRYRLVVSELGHRAAATVVVTP